MIRKIYKILGYLPSAPKTLLFNFHYFPFSTAIKLPVYVSPHVKFERLKGKVVLHEIRSGCVRIGYQSGNAKTKWHNEGLIEFLGNADLRGGCSVWARGHLKIGSEFTINTASALVAGNKVTIGSKVLLSSDITIIDSDFHQIYDSSGVHINASSPIEIGDHVWMGYRSMVLKGSKIPSGSVVGAGSIVTKKFDQENIILAGSPAMIKKENISWKR